MQKSAEIFRPVFFVAAAIMAFSLCSCGSYTRPVGMQRELTPAERNFEITWQASQDVLRRYYFELDRIDRREGLLVTELMAGKHLGEFWRKDGATMRDKAESTLQPIFRRAAVTIRPSSSGANTWTATVVVTVERSEKPSLQLTSTSDAYDMFDLPGGGEKRSKYLLDYGKDSEGKDKGGLVKLGQDEKLAARIQSDIAALVAKRMLR